MADAVHYLVTQLSFVAPYISMGRLYTIGGVSLNVHRICAMWTYDLIQTLYNIKHPTHTTKLVGCCCNTRKKGGADSTPSMHIKRCYNAVARRYNLQRGRGYLAIAHAHNDYQAAGTGAQAR